MIPDDTPSIVLAEAIVVMPRARIARSQIEKIELKFKCFRMFDTLGAKEHDHAALPWK